MRTRGTPFREEGLEEDAALVYLQREGETGKANKKKREGEGADQTSHLAGKRVSERERWQVAEERLRIAAGRRRRLLLVLPLQGPAGAGGQIQRSESGFRPVPQTGT